MKRMLSYLSVFMMVGLLVGCSTKEETPAPTTVSVKDLSNQLSEYVTMPLEIDEQMAKEIYHIDADVVEEYAILDTGRSPGVGTIVLLKAKEGKAEEAKAIVEQIKADKVGKAFYPDEVDAANAAVVRLDGNIAALMILPTDYEAAAIEKYEAAIK